MKFMRKDRIYSIIFWLSMFSILVWATLKAYGIINTPVIVQLIPYIGGIFGAGVFYRMFLDLIQGMNYLKRNNHKFKISFDKMETKLEYVDKDIGFLRNDVELLKNKFLA